MEDLMGIVIAVIAMIVSATNASKKKKQQAQSVQTKKAGHPYTAARPTAPMESATMGQTGPAAKTEPVYMMGQAGTDYVPAKVSVHAHTEPDCEEHDAPGGSLKFASQEGKDPCHEEQMAPRDSFRKEEEEETALELEWSGENMVKAFIMQEVLTRPSQRRAR